MVPPVASPRRTAAAGPVVAGVLVVGCATLGMLGIGHWAATLLPAAYPCGETYQAHPTCRLTDPNGVVTGHLVMIAVPAACSVVGAALAVRSLLRRRRPVLPAAAALAVALGAFLVGQSMADAALADVVAW